MQITNVTIGADPEMFIINTRTNKIVSAIGIIPGEKGNPYTEGMDEGFGVEIDAILAEFNIPPCRTEDEFVYSMKFMKKWIKNYVKTFDPDYDILCKASHRVPTSELLDPKANEIGCAPDYNAYTKRENPKPDGYPSTTRVAGLHVHIGYDNPDFDTNIKLIKYMDLFVGVPSVLYDTDKYRRTLYGQAGSFRKTKYGVEYRSLSSYMLHDHLLPFVWKQTMKAIDACNNNIELPDPIAVQDCINKSNKVLAKRLIKICNICAD